MVFGISMQIRDRDERKMNMIIILLKQINMTIWDNVQLSEGSGEIRGLFLLT